MALRYTLGGNILANEPTGEVKISQFRDEQINGLFFNFTSTLEFWGDGFTILNDAIDVDICQDVTLLIENDTQNNPGVFETLFEGFIILSQLEEFNVDECMIKAQAVDNSFNAKIKNNRTLRVQLDAEVTKNNLNLTPAPTLSIDFFDPTANADIYLGTQRSVYKVFDAMQFVVDYITDKQVAFVSDVFDTDGEFEQHVILSGEELRIGGGNGEAPKVSFDELYEELNKKFRLGFAIGVDGYGQTAIIVEKATDFEDETSAITVNEVKGIKLNYNINELYADVDVGSTEVNFDNTLALPPFRIKSFREENFLLGGECNTDASLNLISNFVIDSNTIQRVLAGSSNPENDDQLDDKVFLVQMQEDNRARKSFPFGSPLSSGTTTSATELTDSTATFVADGVVIGDLAVNLTTGETAGVTAVAATVLTIDFNIFSSGDAYQVVSGEYTYNESLLNLNVLTRWKDALHNNLKADTGTVTNNFEAETTTTFVFSSFPTTPGSGTPNAIFYDNQIVDPDGVYNPVNGQYTPTDGLYSVRTVSQWQAGASSLGTDLIQNGNFSSGNSFWNTPNPAWTIPPFTRANALGTVEFPLLQTVALEEDAWHRVTFDLGNFISGSLDIVLGGSLVAGDGFLAASGISGGGTKTIDIFTQGAGQFNRIKFVPRRGGNGAFAFSIDNIVVRPAAKYSITSRIRRWASGGTSLLDTFSRTDVVPVPPNGDLVNLFVTHNADTFNVFTGDIVVSDALITQDSAGAVGAVVLVAGANFKSTFTENGGGSLVGVTPEDFRTFVYEFETYLKKSDIDNIFDNPKYAILFNRSGDTEDNIVSWRDEIEWDYLTTKTTFKVRSKDKINLT